MPDFSFKVSNCEIVDGWTVMNIADMFFGDPSVKIPIKDGRFSIEKHPNGGFSVSGIFTSPTQAQITLTTSKGETIERNASPVGK